MKLSDLLEDQQFQTNNTSQNFSGKFKQSYDAFNDPKSGAFSTVKSDKTDPHMVKKYNHGPMDNSPDAEVGEDAYEYFVQWLASKNINNPNIVRVYDIKRIQDKTGKHIFKYQIEKLIGSDQIEVDDLWRIFDRYFVRDEQFDQIFRTVKSRTGDSTEHKLIIRLMGRICEEYIKGRSDHVKDDTLKDALEIVKEFIMEYKKSKNFGLDLENSGNIMFRRGQYGYQLVITDPVA